MEKDNFLCTTVPLTLSRLEGGGGGRECYEQQFIFLLLQFGQEDKSSKGFIKPTFCSLPKSYVLSLGGGTPCYAGNIDLILNDEDSFSFYLRGSIPTLFKRLSENKFKRPLINDLSDNQLTEYIAKHLFERSLFYDKATYKIAIDDKEVQEIVTEIRILLH